MIFVTVGTNEAPFLRLLTALAQLGDLGQELVVQTAGAGVELPNARCVEFLPYDEIVSSMREATIVVTHAGVGSVLTALSVGKRPVVVPRLRRFGEAVDDHQVEFARQLGSTGLVRVVEDLAELRDALEPTEAVEPITLGPSPALVAALRADLATVLDSERQAHGSG